MTARSIEAAKEAFEQWRLQKQSGENIPSHLWCLVGALMEDYPLSRIIKQLHLSTKQMRREGLLPLQAPPSKRATPFINIKLPPLASNSAQLRIRRADGAELSYLACSDEQFLLSIKTFLR